MCKCDLLWQLWPCYKAAGDTVACMPPLPIQVPEEGLRWEGEERCLFDDLMKFFYFWHPLTSQATQERVSSKGISKDLFCFFRSEMKEDGEGRKPKRRARIPSKKEPHYSSSFPMTLFVLFLLESGYFWCESLTIFGDKQGKEERKGTKD